MLEDGLWLNLAGQANARAAALADLFTGAGYELAYPVDGNEVFPFLPEEVARRLMAAGAKFYPWPGGAYRFVCSWNTAEADIAALAEALKP
jgi:threonine aldolase